MFDEINLWIQNGFNYQEGVGLYDRYGTDSFFKRLLLRGESDLMAQKLVERLTAMRDDAEPPLAPALLQATIQRPEPEFSEQTEFQESVKSELSESPPLTERKSPVLLQVISQRERTYAEIRSLHPYLTTLPEGPELKALAKRLVRTGKQNTLLWERYNNLTEGREDLHQEATPLPPPVIIDLRLIEKKEAIRKSLNKAENRIKGIKNPKPKTLELIAQRRLELQEIEAKIKAVIEEATR